MATIDNKEIIQNIIANEGYYVGDFTEPPCLRITEYTNAWGRITWGCCFSKKELGNYEIETQFVRNPRIIWDAATGVKEIPK